MLKLTRTGIGLLTRQYRSVLKKCFLINAGLFFALAPAVANAESKSHIDVKGNETVTLIEGKFENLNASSGVIDPIRGGAIYNAGSITNIYGDFITNVSSQDGGAIYSNGTIGGISGRFLNNYSGNGGAVYFGISGYSTANKISGVFEGNSSSTRSGAIDIYSVGHIGTIEGTFNNNYSSWGGAISNRDGNVIIDSIKATFTGNYANGNMDADVRGGAILNQSQSSASYGFPLIGQISGTFSGNYALGTTKKAYGGAIFNGSDSTISNIYDATFIGNYAKSESDEAIGGTIYNEGTITNIGSADNPVLFQDNYVTSESNSAQGGAIWNSGNIGTIYADFIDNRATSGSTGGDTGNAQGAAIHNSGTIGLVVGDFKGNIASNTVGNVGGNDGGAVYNSGTMSITGSFYDNSAGACAGAILNTGTMNLIASSGHDIYFRNNISTTSNGGAYYYDIINNGTLNLNAASGQVIDFGGAIRHTDSGVQTINLGNGYEGAATGGKYIFRSVLNANTLNIGGGAYINFNSLIQANNTWTTGYNYSTNTVVGGAGSIVDAYNGTLTGLNFGNLTLNQDLTVRLEANLWNGDSGSANNIDHLYANSYNGSGSLVIDEIWLHNEKPDTPVTNTFILTDSVLKDHIMLATSGVRVLGLYKNNAYDVTYDSSTGTISLIPNGGGTYNLVGFLTKDTSSTSYSMNYDEYISYMDNHSMVGTNKTVNAGNYTIYGRNNKGFIVGANKSLTINGGVWDGFSDADGGVLGTEVDSTLEITNAIFRNNITTGYDIDGVVLLLGGTTTKLYADFINNHGIPTAVDGHASAWGGVIKNQGTINSLKGNYISNYIIASGTDDIYDAEGGAIINFGLIKEIINSSFTNNSATHTTSGHFAKGGVISNKFTIEKISNSNFTDNYIQAPNYQSLGGAIYNSGTIGKFDTDGTPIVSTGIINATFEGNKAAQGGAIYNEGYLFVSDTDFKKNIAQSRGGTIYNGGTMYLYATGDDVLFSENYMSLVNGNAAGIYNTKDFTLEAKNGKKIIFEGNYGEGDTDGIAITNAADANLSIIGNVIFRNNYNLGVGNGSQLSGIALLNQGHISTIGSVNNQAVFENNHSSAENTRKTEGTLRNNGVIDNLYAEFDNNYLTSTDKVQGGAIYNDNIITNIQNSSFSGNYVSGNDDSKGGAIYNSGDIGFSGTNTFTNNKANEAPNDIYNAGTININGGTTTLNSGYIGSETSALTVKSGATLTANAALEVADGGTLTNESGGTLAVSADNLKIDETTNNGTLELEGGNVTTKLMGTGRMKLMSGNVRLLSSTPPATTGSLSFGSSSDYADSILTFSSAASTSDHALVTAGYLDNNYYMNYGDSMAKSFIKAANDNHKNVIVRSAKHDVTIFGRQSDNTATTTKQVA